MPIRNQKSLYKKNRKSPNLCSALIRLSSFALSQADPDRIVSQALKNIRKIFNAKICWLFLVEDNEIKFKSLGKTRSTQNLIKSQLLSKLSPEILKRTYPIICNHIGELYKNNRALYKFLHGRNIHKFMGVPLKKEGKLVGALNVARDSSSPSFTQEDLKSLTLLGAMMVMTRLKQAEEESRQSQKFLEAIIDNIPNPVFIKDRKHRWVVLNQALSDLVGYPKEKMLGKSDYDFFPKEQADFFWKKDEEMFRSGKVVDIPQEPITDKEGNIHYLHTKKAPLRDSSGRITHLVGIIEDVTERKRAEAKLKESEEKYKTLVETSTDMIFMVDLKGNFQFTNKAFEKNLGYSDEEIKKINGFELVHPEDLEIVKQQFAQLVEGKSVDNMEYRYKTKNGSYINILNNASPIFDSEGNILAALGIARDITEHKQVEESLKLKVLEMNSFINNIPDMAWLKDAESRFIALNKAFGDVVGMKPESLIGQTCEACFGAEAGKKFRKDDLMVMKGRKQISIEEKILDSKENELWLETIKSPIFDHSGKVVGTVGIARNVTERKRAEEALQISKQKFKDLTETTTDWVWEVDEKGVYTYVSPKIKELLGYEVNEVLGKTPFDLMPEGEAERIAKFFKEKVIKKEPFYGLENTNRHKDGHLVVLETNGIPIFDKEGRIIGYRGIDRDITERKRAEEALRQSEERHRTLIETLTDIVFALDREGKFTYLSPRFEEITGYLAQNFVGHSFTEVIAPEYIESTVNRFRRGLSGEKTPLYEIELMHKDGKTVPIELSVTSLLDAEGQAIGRLGVARDITERKRAEKALIRNERIARERARLLIDLRNLDRIDNILTRVCEAVRDSGLFERAVMTLHDQVRQIVHLGQVGLPPDVVKRARQAPPIDQKMRARVTSKKFRISDSFFIPAEAGVEFSKSGRYVTQKRKNSVGGDWQPGDELFVPLRDFSGKIMGYLSVDTPTDGCRPDIKTIEALEMMVEAAASRVREVEAQESLRESEEKHRELVNTSVDGVISVNPQMKIILWNPGAERIFGYTEKEALGQSLMKIVPERYRKAKEKGFVEFRKIGVGQVIGRTLELEGLRKDGTEVSVGLSVSSRRIGETYIATSIVRDISDRKRAEEALQRSERKYRTLVETAQEGIGIVDQKENLIFVNQAFADLLGYRKDKLLGKNLKEISDKTQYSIFQRETEKRKKGEFSKYEAKLLTKSGKPKYFYVSAAPLLNEDGSFIGTLGVLSDLTDIKKAREYNILLDTSRALSRTLKIDRVLRTSMEKMIQVLKADRCAVLLTEDDRIDPVNRIRVYPLKKGKVLGDVLKLRITKEHFSAYKSSLQKQRYVQIFDALIDPVPELGRKILRRIKINSALIIPILAGKKMLGVFHVGMAKKSRTFSTEEVRLALTMANQMAVALENCKLMEDLKREHSRITEQAESLRKQTREKDILLQVSRALSKTINLDEVSEVASHVVGSAMGVERCAVTLASEDGNQLEIKGLFSKEQADDHKLIGTKFLCGDIPAMTKAIKKGKPFVINDTSDIPSKSKTREYFLKVGIKSVLGTGMFFGKKLVGILSITSTKERKTFTQGEIKLVQTMANQIAVAIENARLLQVVKKHTQDLRELSSQLMKVQENERKRIAQELHDEVGQMLQSMKMNLDRIKRNLSAKPRRLEGVEDWLLDTEKLLADTIDDIRTLTFDLRPSMLDDFGLIPTLRWYVENHSRRSNIQVSLKTKDKRYRFPPDIEVTLYRIIQEALTNVSKHAKATEASVSVSQKNSTVILSVRDNGIGFDTSKVLSVPRGIGLLNIKERINLLGGSFEIISRPRKGTILNINIPFSEVKHEEGQITGG